MKVGGVHYRSVWPGDDRRSVHAIDQTRLPHAFEIVRFTRREEIERAIRNMQVRGAPLIGASAAYGLCLEMADDPSDAALDAACRSLLATRPTAVDLANFLEAMREALGPVSPADRAECAWQRAEELADASAASCRSIGEHGVKLIEQLCEGRDASDPVNVLTHCNAGWLATVDWGTALAPIYLAHDRGIPVHVWVDETRPRNQGASLTAWELGQHGVPHTVVVDGAAGHLAQRGRVQLVLTGTDRTTADGDVCNKVGTYLKALAALDNGVPFWVALPETSIDWSLRDGVAEIPIEERDPTEVTWISGCDTSGRVVDVRITPEASPAANPAFDVTPARLVTGFVTERGLCAATPGALSRLHARP
ncbi:MAG: S-methyl-5-thioribose-1-phosphate isomerase [Deltaproteobacteria bacterium]|nr:S-methyl-5-thioribose-1-phosphate isomerase [Deltaproteobacteria bacterium]MBW2445827.1 S-methyl-5-thioribose-1-phosphate isomerase [Deltaproteobacteria bacterium]